MDDLIEEIVPDVSTTSVSSTQEETIEENNATSNDTSSCVAVFQSWVRIFTTGIDETKFLFRRYDLNEKTFLKTFMCSKCNDIRQFLIGFSIDNKCVVEIPRIGCLKVDTTICKVYGTPEAPEDEKHICLNPRYNTYQPVILSYPTIGLTSFIEPEYRMFLKKLRTIHPSPNEDIFGNCVLYTITRLTQVNDGQWMVTSPDVYIGSSYGHLASFRYHLQEENIEAKIRGSTSLYMIRFFRDNGHIVRSLEGLYVDLFFNKGINVLGHLKITHEFPDNSYIPSEEMKSWIEADHPFHQTLLIALKQIFYDGVRKGEKFPTTSVL